jgi:hypothetical protein
VVSPGVEELGPGVRPILRTLMHSIPHQILIRPWVGALPQPRLPLAKLFGGLVGD